MLLIHSMSQHKHNSMAMAADTDSYEDNPGPSYAHDIIPRDYAKNLTEVVFPGVRPLLSPRRALATWKLVRLSTESVVCRIRVFGAPTWY